ncbi:hypothetical protein TIFTF001_054222 [Ficus carica]|uniref:Uncharacterized protein n=1 Tax=Ficus carica TaxID=3494 RepID=A0AA88JHK6_FICCA|nr:hypothetical protein TIFTF001_054222 [Ficus carica]
MLLGQDFLPPARVISGPRDFWVALLKPGIPDPDLPSPREFRAVFSAKPARDASSSPGHPSLPAGLPRVSTRFTSLTA